ncbi:MAG TPA: outer membrane beta-barrel protein [Burkholderiales bacterium]|nr:outer membrane beta-barrel protein [Burkholderiales bacterium]
MTTKWFISMLGAAAVAVSGAAFAQASTSPVPSFYIGAEVGQAEAGDEDDLGYKILGGYQFHRNFAAELGYGILLDKDAAEVTTLELVAVGMWPLGNNFHILGKLGFANWEIDSNQAGRVDGTDLTWGVGAQFDMGRNLGLRAMWQRYEADEEIDFFNVGVIWKF